MSNHNTNKQEDSNSFVYQLGVLYEASLRQPDRMSILNPVQFEKFKNALEMLDSIAKGLDGQRTPIKLNPLELNGYAEIKVTDLTVYGDTLKQFQKLVEYVDVLGIEPSADDQLFININVNDVWKRIR